VAGRRRTVVWAVPLVVAAVLLSLDLTSCIAPAPVTVPVGAGPSQWDVAAPLPIPPSRPPVAARAASPTTAAATPATDAPATAAPPGPGRCPPLVGVRPSIPLQLGTSSGAVTLSWRHGDPAVVAYWVGVQPQVWVRGTGDTKLTESPIVWTRFVPPAPCMTIARPLTGLRRGVDHRVYLEAEVTTPEIAPAVSRVGVSRISGARLP
jgi:hypothetical protein